MDSEKARKFLQCLGEKPVSSNSKWVSSRCPLAPFTHKKGTDIHPSFGVNVSKGRYHCFACGSGSLVALVHDLAWHVSRVPSYAPRYDLKAAASLLEDFGLEVIPSFERPLEQAVFKAFPEEWLQTFIPAHKVPAAVSYAASRGVDEALLAKFDVRYDPLKMRLVFPYRNCFGVLSGARGRSIDPACPKAYRHHDYRFEKHSNAQLVWFNEEALNEGKPVVFVEGQMDVLALAKYGVPAIGNMTGIPTLLKLKKLAGCPAVLCMRDHDQTGELAEKKLFDQLMKLGVNHGSIDYPPEFEDPADFGEKDPEGMKAVTAEIRLFMDQLF